MSLLILKTRPQIVIPELAVRLGLNEALLLQQVQYWLSETTSGVDHNGRRWVYNTIEEWREQFPYLSESTIKRGFNNLKKLGVLNIEQINKRTHDRTNYYSINYEHALLADEVKLNSSNGSAEASRIGQIDPIEQRKMNRSNRAKVTSSNGSNCPDLTESTTENTSEITTENKSSSLQNSGESRNGSAGGSIKINPEAVIHSPNGQLWGTQRDLDCAKHMFEKIKIINPTAKEPNYADWANDIRLMRDIDGRTHEQIWHLFRWANQDSFWYKNILSPRKLREKFDDLTVKSQEPANQGVKVDPVERESAFTRIICSHSKPQNRTEEIAAKLAGNAGIRRMNEFMGRKTWISIWQKAAEQAAKEVSA
ncbi:hypothetical protein [Providencia sneebia]|uniref:Phage replication protein n=1 Tax=Providencia sneebia DSM 19967 TaxID=1141660 RepID=K8W4U9_9GAMM|nr:phage replication protein [Providencia sneebia DSM 19967]EKT55544.1 phage replication protein [Providencia sneebia DSM 19967]